jgi:hypothetical protein
VEYPKDILTKMVQAGTLGYPLSKILNVIEVKDQKAFTKDFDNPESELAKSYQKGIDKADFLLDSKLFDMAKNGDLNALKKYEARKKAHMDQAKREQKYR